MKIMLVVFTVLALAASATSTHICGCGQQPQPQPQPQPHPQQPQPQQPWQHPQQPHPQQPHPQPQPQPQQPWQYPQQPQQPWWQYPQQPQQPCPCHEQQPPQGGWGGSPPPALTQCAEFLRQQCSPLATPFLQPPQQISSGNCQALQQQCCQQLRQVEPQHRQHAILALVQSIVMQQQAQQPYGPQGQIAMLMAAQMSQQLTAMCGLYQQQPGSTCGSPYNVAAGGVRS